MMRLRVAFRNHRLVFPVKDSKIKIAQLLSDMEERFASQILSSYQLNNEEEKRKHSKIYDLMLLDSCSASSSSNSNHQAAEYLCCREDYVEDVLRDGDHVRALDEQAWIDYQVEHFCDRKRAWVHLVKDGVFGEIGYHKKNKVYCLFGTHHHKQYFEFTVDELRDAYKTKKVHEIGIEKDFKGLWYVCAKFEEPTSDELKDDKKMLCEMSIHLKTNSEDDKVYIHQVSVHEKNGHLLKGNSRFF
ncbi:hypothetical protein FDP41_000325 [Naegleria fowleri]|uniref:Uncharacterized protein n=1 Tax=Naegleria fowleri TaxID=5763 RepID=A0A6A5C9K7_NAEFO|nr:uncharacterized protein FDP41_000325 [Naegleria fowleri]KAF0984426.1 hypothetical protein FDP41_000325 [Naegleria fowleri]CAG4715250.1 unnamed protein product [Naegleria fowleri]